MRMPGDDPTWTAVDAYVENALQLGADPISAALSAQRAAGLPDIAVSPTQGKLLAILARSISARRVLEFGTLGGYSTIWLARALPVDGAVVTFELLEEHARVARANFAAAEVADKVEVRVGPAVDNLGTLAADEPFDFVFIDADKPNNVAYYEAAVAHTRRGGLVIVDNVVRNGGIAQADTGDVRVDGSRAVIERAGGDSRVEASVLQTVGKKGYDGLLVATVL